MPDRIANVVILAEDDEQANLVRHFLKQVGQRVKRVETASASGGSGEKFVRDNFAREVHACRSSLGRRASALLVAIIDADNETTQKRRQQLDDMLKKAGKDTLNDDEPVVMLIPKRNVETWVCALLGKKVDENTDYGKGRASKSTSQQIQPAAERLFEITRPHADIPEDFPQSLKDSIPEWKKIPKS